MRATREQVKCTCQPEAALKFSAEFTGFTEFTECLKDLRLTGWLPTSEELRGSGKEINQHLNIK